MTVILVNGSPHEKGSTYTALEQVARGLAEHGVEARIIHIGTNDIPGCKGCYACRKLGRCVVDEDVNTLAESLKEADGMIIGSPVYFASPNASLLALLDRLYAAHGSDLMYKPCGCIVAARRAGTTAALEALYKYPMVNEQPVVLVHGLWQYPGGGPGRHGGYGNCLQPGAEHGVDGGCSEENAPAIGSRATAVCHRESRCLR